MKIEDYTLLYKEKQTKEHFFQEQKKIETMTHLLLK